MLPCFSEGETNTAELTEIEERERLLKDIQQYNRMYSEHPRSVSISFILNYCFFLVIFLFYSSLHSF